MFFAAVRYPLRREPHDLKVRYLVTFYVNLSVSNAFLPISFRAATPLHPPSYICELSGTRIRQVPTVHTCRMSGSGWLRITVRRGLPAS